MQRPLKTRQQFVAVKFRPAAIVFDHLRQTELDSLVCGETLIAGRAAAAAANLVTIFADPGINDVGVIGITKRTFHAQLNPQ